MWGRCGMASVRCGVGAEGQRRGAAVAWRPCTSLSTGGELASRPLTRWRPIGAPCVGLVSWTIRVAGNISLSCTGGNTAAHGAPDIAVKTRSALLALNFGLA